MRLYLITLLLISFFSVVSSASAQELHVSINPTVLHLDATPPSKVEAPFTIQNLSNNPLSLTPRLIPVSPSTKSDGKVTLLLKEEENLSSIIRDRVEIIGAEEDGAITLEAQETKNLLLYLELKSGDPVGDYYFSVVFFSSPLPLEDTSTSSLPGAIAMNVLASIGPKTPPNARIESFTTDTFRSSGPVPFELKVTNTGNHMIQPRGYITIKNLLGKEVGRVKILPQFVLADSSRLLVDDFQATPSSELDDLRSEVENMLPVSIWSERFLMGIYTATAHITLEEGGAALTSQTRFIAFPTTVLLILTGIIFILLGIAYRVRHKLRIHRSKTS